MPLYELDCQDCGEATEVYRSNGKYCRGCALLRKLLHAAKNVRAASRTCRLCAGRFAPLHRRDFLCGTCDPVIPVSHPDPDSLIGRCIICKETTALPHRGVAVCLPCIKTPAPPTPKREKDEVDDKYELRVAAAKKVGRPAVVRALKKGQAARTKKNAHRQRRPIVRIDDNTRAPA